MSCIELETFRLAILNMWKIFLYAKQNFVLDIFN